MRKLTNKPAQNAGLSLIELLIAITIVGLLAAIALPSYNSSIRNSNRADARSELLLYQTRLEKCFSANRTFLHSDDTPCGASQVLAASGAVSGEQLYRIEFEQAPAASRFVLVARAIKGPQLSDVGCLAITLDNIGNKLPLECW